MDFIPSWITKAIESEKLYCRKCKNVFINNNLKAIGIRESIRQFKKQTLFVEMICSNCKELMIFELSDMTLVEFSFEIIEELHDIEEKIDKKNNGTDKKKIKSKITIKEKNNDIKLLQTLKTSEEFLMAMGFSPGEIEQYSLKEEKNDK